MTTKYSPLKVGGCLTELTTNPGLIVHVYLFSLTELMLIMPWLTYHWFVVTQTRILLVVR